MRFFYCLPFLLSALALPHMDSFDELEAREPSWAGLEKRDSTGRCPNGIKDLGVAAEPNGCGPKGHIDLVPDGALGDCCNAHDRCYANCARSKKECDSAFGNCVIATCKQKYGSWNPIRYTCITQGAVYTDAVVIAGGPAFKTATKEHCKCL